MNRTFFRIIVFTLMLISVTFLGAESAPESDMEDVLNVYCYDSFSGEWGPGPIIAEAFTAETGIGIVFHAPGDAVTVLNQLILEQGASAADVLVGMDNSLLQRVLEADLLEPYESPALAAVDPALIFDETFHLLPYDYGHFAINYDSAVISDPPASLEDLTAPEYEGQLVLMDPRTSTPGLGFLLWTVAVYGDDWPAYWERLKPSILTVADGWSTGYALYTAGEAPLVLSYGSSPAYHGEYEGTDRYRAAEFTDGHVAQIEGMGILRTTANRGAAEAFIDFMLGPAAQEAFAMANIMLPVTDEVALPASFDLALRPGKVVDAGIYSDAETEAIIARWTEVFGN